MQSRSQFPAWQALEKHFQRVANLHMFDLFKQDPQRQQRFSLHAAGLYADFSKHRINAETLALLIELARACELPDAIKALFSGAAVNFTEARPALHHRCRQPQADAAITQARTQMQDVVTKIREQRWLNEGKIKHIIHIGIGGSDIGGRLLSEALAYENDCGIDFHFISNCDNNVIAQQLAACVPEQTLVIIASKSFTSHETLSNADVVLQWLGRERVATQVIAVTAKAELALGFGIAQQNILPIWDWLGGRYSIWSAMGLPVAIAVGMDCFNEFLAGGHAMDQHFANIPLEQNLPVILALLSVWYNNFFHSPTQAILPYSSALQLLPAYLQQLSMESLGKVVTSEGDFCDYNTGNIIWGDIGTNCQHSFLQLLHQSYHLIPVDFILPLKQRTPLANSDLLFANCLAQAQALMLGNNQPQPEKTISGNKPSTLLVMPELNAYYLGALLALYEHKTYCQSVIWDINAFDQFGVELGKQMASSILQIIQGQAPIKQVDPSTQSMISKYLAQDLTETTAVTTGSE